MTDSSSPIHNLPQANASFTVTKGTGAVQHNLESALHHATLSSSSHLHPLKEHIGAITKVFNSSFVKQAIRSGGYHDGVAKSIKAKIMQMDPKFKDDVLKKKVLNDVINYYKKSGQTHKAGVGKDGKVLARYRYHGEEETVTPGHAASASALAHGGAEQPSNSGTVSSQQHAYTSISQMSSKKPSPTHGQTGYMIDGDNSMISTAPKASKPPSTSLGTSSLNLKSLPINPKSLGSGGLGGNFRPRI